MLNITVKKLCNKNKYLAESTDDGDDKRDRYSVVVGKLDKIFPEFKYRLSTHDKRWDLTADDLFEEGSDNYEYDLDFTEELKKINQRVYTAPISTYVQPVGGYKNAYNQNNPNNANGYSSYYGQGNYGTWSRNDKGVVTHTKPDNAVGLNNNVNPHLANLEQCDVCKSKHPRWDLETIEDVKLCDICKRQFMIKKNTTHAVITMDDDPFGYNDMNGFYAM